MDGLPQDGYTPSPIRLGPVIVVTSPPETSSSGSLGNMVPLSVLSRTAEFMDVAASALSRLRFFGGVGCRLDIWFHDGVTPYRGQPVSGRPLIFWAGSPNDAEFLSGLVTLGPLFSVVVSSYESHLTELEAFLAAEHPNHRCSFRTMVREASASPESQSNAVLWAAFAEQLKLVAPSLHDAWWLETRYSSARTIPSDMVTAPNEILAALGAFGLPVFDGEPTPAGERTRLSVASAREVLGRRWLGALQAGDDTRKAERVIRTRLSGQFAEDEIRAGVESLDADLRSADLPFELLAALAVPELILVCPSFSKDIDGVEDRLQVGTVLRKAHSEAEGYFIELVDAFAEGGSRVVVRPPVGAAEEMVYGELIQGMSDESRFYSGLAVLHATRTFAPVLKLERVGMAHAEPFRDLNTALVEDQRDRLVELSEELTKEVTARIDETYIPLFRTAATAPTAPRIHTFSDYPLEFATVDGDYLGFTANLSRTPISPGTVPLANYTATESPAALPTDWWQLVVVNALQEDTAAAALIANVGPGMKPQLVTTKEELCRRLAAPHIGCLIFVGHGFHDPDADWSALVLGDGLLKDQEIEQLERVPEAVVLLACSSAAATSIERGVARAFLSAGSQVVVASTFALPEVDAALFARWLVRLLLIPTERRDAAGFPGESLSEIVTTARNGARPMSAFLDLARRGAWSQSTFESAVAVWDQRIHDAGVHMDPARPEWRRCLGEVLEEFDVIAHAEVPAREWPVVPYPLFLSTLGYPWNLTRPAPPMSP